MWVITTLEVRREEPGKSRALRTRCGGPIGPVAILFEEPSEAGSIQQNPGTKPKESKSPNDQQVCANYSGYVRVLSYIRRSGADHTDSNPRRPFRHTSHATHHGHAGWHHQH